MKHIRILSLSLALVLMLGLFSACGKSGSGSESGSASQPDASVSLPQEDVSTPDISTPDASQPEEETPAPEVKPEEKPQTPAPEAKPEQKPEIPAPEVKPEEKPEEPAPQPEQKPASVDLEAFYQTIFTDPDNAPMMEAFPAEGLDAFYPGLTAIPTSQRVAYMASISAVPCEIVMVECANAADVAAVKAILQTRIDDQVNNQYNYPMVIEAWETEAKVVSNGNFVALFVVSGMTEEVVSNFNALF